MAKEEVEEVTEYEEYADYFEDKTEKDKSGQVKFKSVNHHKRAEANEVESDGETATYANYALEYFGYRCALSGEKFIVFDNPVERERYKRTSNLSAEHVVALTTGGNDIIPNIVPTVLQYNVQKNGYYILDWWPKAKDVNGNPIYTPEKLLKIVNYMLKSLQIRKDLGIKKQPREYRKRLLTSNGIDEFLMQEEIVEGLLSDTMTATTEVEDGKNILTQIPQQEGAIPSLAKQKEIKITEAMFLTDALKVLEQEEKIPQEIISKLQNMYKEVEGEIPFEIEVRKNILATLEQMGIENNKYTVANDLLINSDILKIIREFDNESEMQNIIQKYIENKVEELKAILSEEQVILAISNMPDCIYNDEARNKIKFWKENREENLEKILKRLGNQTDVLIDSIIKLQEIGVDTSNINLRDTIEELAKKSGITKEQIKQAGLSPEEKIGRRKSNIAFNYRKTQQGEKTNGTSPTEEQLEELLKLGISLELQEKINPTEKFIEDVKALKEIGVDISKMVQRDTIESLAEKSGITKEQIEQAGLSPEDSIGSQKNQIAINYRKAQQGEETHTTPATEEQVEELLKLGISLELQENINQIEKFIENITALQEIGVDVSKITSRDTIESLAKKSGVTKEQIEQVGLNPKDNIGYRIKTIAGNYRKAQQGKEIQGIPPTKEQVEELLKLGISLELQENINQTEKFIEDIKALQEIGVDTSKIKKRDTIESLAKKSGIMKEQIEQAGLNPEENIGNQKNQIASNYRKVQQGKKTNGNPPTEEQVEELLKLGISLELQEKINPTEKFIEDIKVLQEIGVDISKIKQRDTIESLAKKSGITKEQIEQVGLSPEDNIGYRRDTIAGNYRKVQQGKKIKGTPPTKEQVEELLRLGISIELVETKSQTEKFIQDIKVLQKIGVDVSKITSTDTIESLAKKSGITKEQIEQVGLNKEDKIGKRKNNISDSYRKAQQGKETQGIPPTKEQVEELLELGISLEKINLIEAFIEDIKILQKIGVDISKLVQTDTIESLAKKSGITKGQIEQTGLSPEDNIGHRRDMIAGNYRKAQQGEKIKGIPPTEKQVEELLELGILLEKINSIEAFIEDIKILQKIGVDISKMVQRDTIESLAKKSGITKEQIEQAGLNPTENIGKTKSNIKSNYRKQQIGEKTNGVPPTEEQVKKLLELGISLESKSKKKIKDTVKQNKGNLYETIKAGEELEAEILMVEKTSERSASDGRGQ